MIRIEQLSKNERSVVSDEEVFLGLFCCCISLCVL